MEYPSRGTNIPVLDNLTHDAALTLRAIFSLTQATRASILNETGLSKGRSTAAIQELRDLGFIASREETPQGQGRPSFIYSISPGALYAVGAALKVGMCRISVVSGAGDILENISLPTPTGAFEEQELLGVLAKGPRRVSVMRFPASSRSFRRAGHFRARQGGHGAGGLALRASVWTISQRQRPRRVFHLEVAVIVEDHARSVAFGEMRARGAPRERTLRFSTWVKVWGRPSSWTAGFTGAVTGWRVKSGMWRCRGMTSDASAATPGAWRR